MKLLLRSVLIACAFLLAALKLMPPAHSIVVFGDSLSAAYGLRPSEGWVALLTERLRAKGYGCTVVNASVSGETSAGGRSRLVSMLRQQHPDIVILELGANDALRGLPTDAMATNLEAMILTARDFGAKVLLVGTPLPANYGEEYARDVAAAYARTAQRTHAAFVPSLLAGVTMDPKNFQADQLHPVAAAQTALLDTVWTRLVSLLGAPTSTGAPREH